MWRWVVAGLLVVTPGCRKAPRRSGGVKAEVAAVRAQRPVDGAVAESMAGRVFASFAELAQAGPAAVGHRAELGLRRAQLRPSMVVAVSCQHEYAEVVELGFSAAQRDLVRALPRDAPGCTRVLLEIDEVEVLQHLGADGGALPGPVRVRARALEFPGLTALPALAAPARADFGDLDEIVFAGADAEGKVAELRAQLDGRNGLNLIACGRDGRPRERQVGDLIWVVLPAAQAAPAPHDDCRKVRFRVHPRQASSYIDPSFEAELLLGAGR